MDATVATYLQPALICSFAAISQLCLRVSPNPSLRFYWDSVLVVALLPGMRSHMAHHLTNFYWCLGLSKILGQSILPSALAGRVLRNAPLPTRQGHSLRTDLTAGIEAVFLLGSPRPSKCHCLDPLVEWEAEQMHR